MARLPARARPAVGTARRAGGPWLPAEWEPHEATWIAWPHNRSDWPGRFGPIPWVYADLVRKLAAGERVRILVNDAAHQASARRHLERHGADLARVDFLRIPTDRVWTRDSGPIVVRTGPRGERAVAGFRFNAWAKYPDSRRDARIPERAAAAVQLPLLPVRHLGRAVVLEGGAIDVNGAGTVLATEECLLDPRVQVRNPGFGRADYETVFREALGCPATIWLGRGIAGDDTHGHVDDLARFVSPRTIVLARADDPAAPNHAPLAENRARLASARLADGSRPEVVDLPMPRPVRFAGQRLPASYANFYVSNAAVLVPTFNDPADRRALGILAELFPGRSVVGIHALDLVWGLGTLHCMTQQEPAARPA
ncbi:MAG TPA: agmatine deiminase family protein [Anaeromyxobacteraceae bacterium]|nr:agmatine deiminase family protein [Anaeromyxobacteraceae bacterium]